MANKEMLGTSQKLLSFYQDTYVSIVLILFTLVWHVILELDKVVRPCMTTFFFIRHVNQYYNIEGLAPEPRILHFYTK